MMLAFLIAVVALGFWFYERTKELKMAEEKAKAVGERVFEIGGVTTTRDEGGDLKPE
jgi:hypothetical protein